MQAVHLVYYSKALLLALASAVCLQQVLLRDAAHTIVVECVSVVRDYVVAKYVHALQSTRVSAR